MADGLPAHPALAEPPRRQRADARIAIRVERMGATSRVAHVAESGSARVRMPKVEPGPVEAVTINTGGGITGGDRFRTAVEVGRDAELTVTSAAAEKIYRSDGDLSRVETTLRVEAGGRAEWMPQETILFERARLERRLDVDLDASASALLFEAAVFGRAAMGEEVRDGIFRDRWRVRRDGRLVYADTLRLEGDIARRLAEPTVAAGGRAVATCLVVAPDAEARLDEAREMLEGARSECGASAWSGMLVARWLAKDIAMLRADAGRFMTAFRGRPLPRVWHT